MDNKLYINCWSELLRIKVKYPALLEPEGTPVLAFGNWDRARVATAGLNPSEREFRENGIPLALADRRFLHFSEVDESLSAENIKEALERFRQYFLRNPYGKWFNHYEYFLAGMNCSFKTGEAVHTDYFSPFATATGLADVESGDQLQDLSVFGLSMWKEVLSQLPKLEIIFGHGQGHARMPALFGFKEWDVLSIPFAKPIRGRCPFLHKEIVMNGRRIQLFWWKPNLNGHPLTILTNEERKLLGQYVGSVRPKAC